MGKTTFADGNPETGTLGTIVTADFLNAVNNHRHSGLDVDGAGAIDYATDTGSADAYEIALSPALTQHIIGLPIYFMVANTNTGAATLEVNGMDAVAIKKNVSDDLSAGDLIAGKIVMLVYDGTYYQLLGSDSGKIVQVKHAVITSVVSGSTLMVFDDTIPQNTEGFDIGFAETITPGSASNILLFLVTCQQTHASADLSYWGMALFQDGVASALKAQLGFRSSSVAPYGGPVCIVHRMVAGGTEEMTFRIRIGAKDAGTMYVNSAPGGVGQIWGGVNASPSMTILEIKP